MSVAHCQRREKGVGERKEHKEAGLLYGIAAYGWWGLMPLYFKAVETVPPWQLLAQRVVWSLVLLALLLTLWRRWPDFRLCLQGPRTFRLLCLSALLVGGNWYVYIYGVTHNRIIETSLGYFINPLLSVLLGMVFFRERLRRWQWVAVVLATLGVGYHIWVLKMLPWIALVLAASFGTYGLIRKVTPVDGLLALAVETLVLVPIALAYLAWEQAEGHAIFGRGWWVDGLVVASGVVTTVPLLCFGQAARRLPLSTLGFLQYLAPSMQLSLAVWCYGESFREHVVSFGLIWAGLLIFTIDSLRNLRRPAAAVMVTDI
jgi:chloramphenicol-sensitive protein RarD